MVPGDLRAPLEPFVVQRLERALERHRRREALAVAEGERVARMEAEAATRAAR